MYPEKIHSFASGSISKDLCYVQMVASIVCTGNKTIGKTTAKSSPGCQKLWSKYQ